jgi:hypothetical protein
MVSAAENMLAAAQQLLHGEGGGGVGVRVAAAARRAAQIEETSHEIAGGQVADMSALMQAAAAPAPAGGGPSGPAGPPPEQVKARPILRPVMRPAAPPAIRDLDVTAPARKFYASDHPAAKWVFVDSWYTIGPFPNPARANIHRKFPPESVVDLDGVYEGMFGPVRWQYLQSYRPLIEPPNSVEYGIWYAYTELYFESECDLWIAVGSDDRSDLWINDVRVWSSSDVLKGWTVGEGFRRVHFQPGRNRILCRVENGWHVVGFSLCLNVGG